MLHCHPEPRLSESVFLLFQLKRKQVQLPLPCPALLCTAGKSPAPAEGYSVKGPRGPKAPSPSLSSGLPRLSHEFKKHLDNNPPFPLGNGSVQGQDLDSIILVDIFPLSMFCDSVIS